MTGFETILDGATPLAYLIRHEATSSRTDFVTRRLPHAGRVHRLPGGRRGRTPRPRAAGPSLVGTSEVLVVRSGRCEMDVYDDAGLVATRELTAGDVVSSSAAATASGCSRTRRSSRSSRARTRPRREGEVLTTTADEPSRTVIPVNEPVLGETERQLVDECVDVGLGVLIRSLHHRVRRGLGGLLRTPVRGCRQQRHRGARGRGRRTRARARRRGDPPHVHDHLVRRRGAGRRAPFPCWSTATRRPGAWTRTTSPHASPDGRRRSCPSTSTGTRSTWTRCSSWRNPRTCDRGGRRRGPRGGVPDGPLDGEPGLAALRRLRRR